MKDQDFLDVLTAHGASGLDDCFLVKDSRSREYSAGIFDRTGKPLLLMDDDEEFRVKMVEYLWRKNVRSYQSAADLIK